MESDLSEECPLAMARLETLLEANSELFKNEEALLYALAQVLHDKIKDSSLHPEEKGATVSNIVTAFRLGFLGETALFNERLRYLVEQKHSTIH